MNERWTMPRRCGNDTMDDERAMDDAETMRRRYDGRCRDDAETMPRRCGDDAETMPRRCLDDAETKPRRCGDDAETMRRRCGDDAETIRPSVVHRSSIGCSSVAHRASYRPSLVHRSPIVHRIVSASFQGFSPRLCVQVRTRQKSATPMDLPRKHFTPNSVGVALGEWRGWRS
jgi:hypothetical protein